MRVAIIGGGAAGLSSAKHVKAGGHECELFEMAAQVGGTWVYTDDVGKDKYGFPVYSAMYQGLRTNLPKEVMGFPDFPIPDQNKSYLTQAEILEFLTQYVEHFELGPIIKTNHMVTEIRPLENDRWQITAIYKPTNTRIVKEFDSVIICNGHYNEPTIPKFEGQEKFKGQIFHSHKYRSPKPFAGLRVLVVGAGPSGLDMALHISKVAEKVVLSHHVKEAKGIDFLEQKPDIRRILDETMVEFVDGTSCCFDCILLCTGFKYSFPFLHETCGITITDNHIQPLYKHMIHIEKPTMCFIGIPFNVCAFQMFDLQARFYCKYLNGSMALPSKDSMHLDTKEDMQIRWEKGYTRRQAHMMGPDQQKYYDDLARMAATDPIAPVIIKLRDHSVKRLYEDLNNFRENRYKIVDDDTYVKVQ
ncbi:senecionine N-oxygenase [Coccinella septempunctata]|uniref:senecionine N-oxygenase n=1 Tax=Coccinella septempunctata TaxID=41139 RepID=UPI001D07DF9F|nr:senecionine N-oxygenase [Coccinella septempunctata]